jgi:ABC-type multidrug transport system fused ATPase/permease subunit
MSKMNAQDLRLFHAAENLTARYSRIWNNLFSEKRKLTGRRALRTGMLECLPEITATLIAIDIAYNVLAGVATIGDYTFYTGLIAQVWASLQMLSSSLIEIYDNRLRIENFKTLDSFQSTIKDGSRELSSVETIEYERVSFSYPQTQYRALDEISFKLEKSQKLALVGVNGSGKSTLIKLLLRMYDPDSGVIRINGLDIKEYRLESLRANFSVYFQNTPNYYFNLRENFTIADEKRESADKAMEEALKLAAGSEILPRAVKGLDSGISRYFDPEGIELSVGQHQKLALARTFFRRHTALVLDEPSSSLDPQAEDEVFAAVKQLTENKMTIFTSHRLSNVYLADRIIVLERGRVIEDGSQEEPLNNQHRFAELF